MSRVQRLQRPHADGAINDAQRESSVTQHSARDAIDALLDGKTVTVATTKAFSCSIKRVRST